jgi:hypothetical protein
MKDNRKPRGVNPLPVAVLFCLLLGVSAAAQKKMHIMAVAQGTSTQMGRIINVDLRINEYSTPADQAALIEAFQADGTKGLANALDKMKSKGRMAITGTLGYDVNYIREFMQPDGSRKIRFVTDRQILFGEAWHSTRSMDYMISMVEINIEKGGKVTDGMVLPAAKVKLNKRGELEVETYQNPWKLTNIRIR